MKRYTELIAGNRYLLYLILVLLIIGAGLGIKQIEINPEFEMFRPRESEYADVLDHMEKEFNNSEQITILLEHEGEKLHIDQLKEYRKLQTFLNNNTDIESIQGPAPETIRSESSVIEFDKINENDLVQLKNYYQNLGKISPVIFLDGNIYASYTVFPRDNFALDEIKAVEDFLEENNFEYYITGDIYMREKIVDYVKMILFLLPPLAFLLLLFVFKTQIGSLKGTLISILPAIIAAQWTVGIVGWSGREVSIVTVLAPIFTIVIGSADGLHFVSHVQEARSAGENKFDSVVQTLRIVGMPLLITTVTSMAGFLSLLVMDTEAINDLALFAALGIFLAGVVTWIVLPLVLTGSIKMQRREARGKWISTGIKKLWGKSSLVILVIIILVALFGIRNLKTEFNQLMIYRDFTVVHQSFEKIMDVNQGSVPVFVYLETEDDPLEPQLANSVLDFGSDLMADERVGKVLSVYDFYSIMYAQNRGLDFPRYPQNMRAIDMIYSITAAEGDNQAANFVRREEKKTRMMIFPQNLDNDTLDFIEREVNGFSRQNEGITARVTGAQYLMRDLNQEMINNQSNTMGVAFLIIFILLLISLKSVKYSL
ncbi:MAG: efflux RND transporter permease subunit, partial [Bacillota bacterium]